MSERVEGYIAMPEAGRGPAVLLLHTWWGLNQPVKDLADRLAGDGFTVSAPDLFEGRVLTTVEEAAAHGDAMDAQSERINAVVDKSLDEVLQRPDVDGDKAALVAMSFGVWYAGQVASARSDVAALVCIYGDVFEGPNGLPYLGHFAENAAFVDSAGAELQAAVARGEAHVYPGTQHWFMEPDRPEYDRDAAELAYARTVEFLGKHLG